MESVGLYYKVQSVGRRVFWTCTVIEKPYILWKKNWSFVLVIIWALLADELIKVISSVPWLCISLILFHAVLSQAVWQSHPCLQANKTNQGLSFRTSVLRFLEVSRSPWLFQEKSGFQCLGDFAAAWITWGENQHPERWHSGVSVHRTPKLLTQGRRLWMCGAGNSSLSHSLYSRGGSVCMFNLAHLQSVRTKPLTFSSLYHFKDDIIASYVWFKSNNWLFHQFFCEQAQVQPKASQLGWPVAKLDTPNACRVYVVLRPLSLSKQRDLNIWLKSQFWLKDKCELFRNARLDPGTALWEPFQQR